MGFEALLRRCVGDGRGDEGLAAAGTAGEGDEGAAVGVLFGVEVFDAGCEEGGEVFCFHDDGMVLVLVL